MRRPDPPPFEHRLVSVHQFISSIKNWWAAFFLKGSMMFKFLREFLAFAIPIVILLFFGAIFVIFLFLLLFFAW